MPQGRNRARHNAAGEERARHNAAGEAPGAVCAESCARAEVLTFFGVFDVFGLFQLFGAVCDSL